MKEKCMTQLSHDLMTPLNQVLGMAQLINLGKEPEKESDYHRKLMAAGEDLTVKLTKLIEAMNCIRIMDLETLPLESSGLRTKDDPQVD